MFAFLVLDLIFLVLNQEIGWENVSKMIVLGGM